MLRSLMFLTFLSTLVLFAGCRNSSITDICRSGHESIQRSADDCRCLNLTSYRLHHLERQFADKVDELQQAVADSTISSARTDEIEADMRVVWSRISELRKLHQYHRRRFHDTSAVIAVTPVPPH